MAQPQAAVDTPALQILVELAGLQDQEVGDGTTSVVICAAELLKRANDLVRNKIHPTSIISGYRLAMREVSKDGSHVREGICRRALTLILRTNISARTILRLHSMDTGCSRQMPTSSLVHPSSQACKFIEENLAIRVDTLGKDALINCAKTAMSSKIIGGADEDFFSKMAVDAMLAVKTTNSDGKARWVAVLQHLFRCVPSTRLCRCSSAHHRVLCTQG